MIADARRARGTSQIRRTDFIPSRLSKRQLLHWLQEALTPSVSTLERVLDVELERAIDPDRFRAAFASAVRATPALRLVVDSSEGTPAPSILAEAEPCAVVEDLDPSRWDAAIAADVETPLDLTRCCYQSTLYVAAERARWCLRIHPIVADLPSLRLIANRVAQAYGGAAVPVDDAFSRFLEREMEYRASPVQAEDAEIWAQRLQAPREELTFYGRTPDRNRLAAERHVSTLLADDVKRLDARVRELDLVNTTPRTSGTTTLLATATLAYLARVTQSARIGLGIPIDVRTEDGAGPMTEICPVEIDVRGDDTFRTLLERVQDDLTEMAPRARHAVDNRFGVVAYDAVLDLVDLRIAPFGDTIPTASAGLSLLHRGSPAEKTPRSFASLSVQVARVRGGELQLALDLAEDAFAAAHRPHVPEHFLAVLRAMLDDLDTTLDDVDLLSDAEREDAAPMVEPVAPPASEGVVPTILARANAHPERIAVEGASEALTYATFVERASALAAYLRDRGVRNETRVAFCLDRTEDLPVVLLAIHLAGGAFVPLDPTHPRERTALILEDAEPTLLLTISRFVSRLRPPSGTTVVCLDADRDAIFRPPSGPVGATPSSAQLAYIIYTSGSTGKPKGVELEHAALTNLIVSMTITPGMGATDRLLAVTTPSFDIAILELLTPLYAGGTVVIAPSDVAADPVRLAEWIAERRITIMQATPATWRGLVDTGWPGASGLRVMCGGEVLPSDLADELLARTQSLFNMYGPTETTIWSTVHAVTEPSGGARVPIGRPIDATELYVVTPKGKLVPDGISGELCIGGAGLARGYHGRPDLTGERFVPHPFAEFRSVYRTGDLARRREDGAYECLGRLDDQVKVRGFRIELSEIEVAIRAHPQIGDAAVIVREDRPGDRRIVAYVVPSGAGVVPFASSLREHLAERLPPYMIPSSFVVLSALPLTPNGKVDRRVLRPPPTSRSGLPSLVRPRNDVELQIAALWQEVLGLDDVGVNDDFFELGGHSLNAVTLLAGVRDTLGIQVNVAEFFSKPTVEALAALVDAKAGLENRAAVIPLERRGAGTPLFCVCGLQIYHELARAMDQRRPVYGVLSPAEVDFLAAANPDVLPDVPTLARQYVDAIQATQPSGPYALAGVSFGGLLALEAARQLKAAGEQVTSVVLLDVILGRAIRRGARRWISNQMQVLLRSGRKRLTGVVAPKEGVDALDRLRMKVYDERAEAYERVLAPYDGDVVVVRAKDNDSVGYEVDRDLGWTPLVRGRLVLYEIPGDHLGILKGSSASRLARALNRHLG